MKWFPFLSGVLSLLLGIYIFSHPAIVTASIGWLFALVIFIIGLSSLFEYFQRDHDERRIWTLIQSIFSIIFGIIMLSSSVFSISSAVIAILAYWVLLSGILQLIAGFRLRQIGLTSGSRQFGTGIIAILFGLILLGQPLLTAAIIGRFVGVLLIFVSFSAFATFFRLR